MGGGRRTRRERVQGEETRGSCVAVVAALEEDGEAIGRLNSTLIDRSGLDIACCSDMSWPYQLTRV